MRNWKTWIKLGIGLSVFWLDLFSLNLDFVVTRSVLVWVLLSNHLGLSRNFKTTSRSHSCSNDPTQQNKHVYPPRSLSSVFITSRRYSVIHCIFWPGLICEARCFQKKIPSLSFSSLIFMRALLMICLHLIQELNKLLRCKSSSKIAPVSLLNDGKWMLTFVLRKTKHSCFQAISWHQSTYWLIFDVLLPFWHCIMVIIFSSISQGAFLLRHSDDVPYCLKSLR